MRKSFLIPLLFASTLVIISGQVAAESSRYLQFSDFPDKAMTADGFAKIIVELHVPNIEELSRKSASFDSLAKGEPGTEVARAAMASADMALSMAILSEANKVLHRLPAQSHRINRRYNYFPFLALDVKPEVFLMLQADSLIKAIYPDTLTPLPIHASTGDDLPKNSDAGKGSVQSAPVSPSMSDSIGLIGADKAWARGYTGSGWYVAILDTGIRRTHEFFQGKDIVEACFASGEVYGSGDCQNGQTTMYGVGSAAHYSSMYDGYDHGTHVAGTAAGKRSNNTLFGVARDAGIIAVNVFSKFSAVECGGSPCVMTYASDQISGLDFIYGLRGTYNIGAVNMSLGGGEYNTYCDESPQKTAIDRLRSVNIPTAISTGNQSYCGSLGSPGCISSAIAVMASSKADVQAQFSNWHRTVADLFAPGQSILSSTGGSNNSYDYWNGTSMAAPHVAGALTLMRQYDPSAAVETHLTRITELGPSIQTLCSSGGSKPRLYVDNFGAPPINHVLTVQSTGASSVPITTNPSTYGDTTNYTKTNIPNDTSITLTAPATSGSANFTSWTGCDSTSAANRTCTVSMTSNKTVTANYSESTEFNKAETLFNWMQSLPQSVFTGSQGTQQEGGMIYRQYAHGVRLATNQGSLLFTNRNGVTVNLGSVDFWLIYAQADTPNVQFAGSMFSTRPDVQNSQQGMNTLTNAQWVTSFYIAYLNRAADPAGLQSWSDILVQGDLSIPDVADSFVLSEEAQRLIPQIGSLGAATDADRIAFLQALYRNLLNLKISADSETIQGKAESLRTGAITPGGIVGEVILTAMQEGLTDWQTIWNKVQVAEYFTQRFEANGRAWQDSDFDLARQALKGVTDDPDSVDTGKFKVDQLLL